MDQKEMKKKRKIMRKIASHCTHTALASSATSSINTSNCIQQQHRIENNIEQSAQIKIKQTRQSIQWLFRAI